MENIRRFLKKVTPVGFFGGRGRKLSKILMVGPQGSGKTTQAKILAEVLGFKFLGMGELLRGFVKNANGSESQKIAQIMSEGGLVDDKTVCEIVKKELTRPEYKSGIIVDGYPRTVNQCKIYDPNFDKVFYIKVSDKEATKRLLARGRADDTEEAIKER